MPYINTDNAQLVDQLNDLLQLDYDAIAAYRVALAQLDTSHLRDALRSHLQDHERHLHELESHLDAEGGTTMRLPQIASAFELAVEAATALSNDRSVLLAFKVYELQMRDRYERAAEQRFPPAIAQTLKRAVADERGHYEWAVRALEAVGVKRNDVGVTAAHGVERLTGDGAGGIGSAMRRSRQAPPRPLRIHAHEPWKYVGAGLALIGAGALVKTLLDRR